LDWQPAKNAARHIAFAEDGAVFEGYAAAGIGGIRQGTAESEMLRERGFLDLARRQPSETERSPH